MTTDADPTEMAMIRSVAENGAGLFSTAADPTNDANDARGHLGGGHGNLMGHGLLTKSTIVQKWKPVPFSLMKTMFLILA